MYQDDYLITSHSFRLRNSQQFFKDHKKSYERRLGELGSVKEKFKLCPELTILIPTCIKHKESTELLCKELDRQGLYYVIDDREGIDLGTKRQDLYKQCESIYSVQWDADDWVSGDFSQVLHSVLKNDVDCINFLEHVIMGDKTTITRRSIHFPWSGCMFGGQYAFSPTPKSIIKTQIAQKVEFEKGHDGEDLKFARDVRQYLKSEINLDYIGYYYEYCDDGSTTLTNSEESRQRRARGEK